MNLQTIPLATLMAKVRSAEPGAREELAHRADSALLGVDARSEAIGRVTTTCVEHAYGRVTRLSFQIKVF
jgi:hypothetical protein